jgi:hypothetical protein
LRFQPNGRKAETWAGGISEMVRAGSLLAKFGFVTAALWKVSAGEYPFTYSPANSTVLVVVNLFVPM